MSQYKNYIFALTNWLIIAFIVWLWIAFALRTNTTHDNSVSIKDYATTSDLRNNNDSIEKYHIFGSAQELYETPLVTGNTSLNLSLNGTMSNSDAETGLAYISNNQGMQKKFKVGDKVFNLATLKEIYKTYIVLSHNGKNERLKISEHKTATTNRKTKKNKSNNSAAYLQHLNGNQLVNLQETLNQQKFDTDKISSIVNNINLVTDQAGQIKGLRISNIVDGDLLKKHGLKSNDIITAINGNKVSQKNIFSIQETLQQNPNATVTIKRNGKIQNIQVNLRSL